MKDLVMRVRTWGFAFALLAVGAPAYAATLYLSSATAVQGQSSKICVSLEDGENEIAGLQTNLVWDDTCMTPSDARRLCKANAASGKSVQTALQGRGVLKAIVISFSDVNPIPDGEVFCCEFLAIGGEGQRCLGVRMENIIGSTDKGMRIDGIIAGNVGGFTILGGAPWVPPTQVTSGAERGSGGGGCAMSSGARSGDGVFLIATFAAALYGYRRIRRKR